MSIFRLKELRDSKSVSVKQLSVATGLSTDAIRSIESGLTKNPRKETLKVLANYFNVNIKDLYVNGVKPKKEKYKSSVDSNSNSNSKFEGCLMSKLMLMGPKITKEFDFNETSSQLKELLLSLKLFIENYKCDSIDKAVSEFNLDEFDCLFYLNKYFNDQVHSEDFDSEKLHKDIIDLCIENLIAIYNHLVDIRSILIGVKSKDNSVISARSSVLTNCSRVNSIIDFVNTCYLMKSNIPYATRCIDSKFVSIIDK